jgi:exosortase E/protease (VPEID-CTERM system)
LAPILPNLSADASALRLGTDRFAVIITEGCSGLEGMSLMLAFCGAWLLYFRRDYIFPRALLLIPVGLLAIFGLNVLRIAILILIGHGGFPGVAVYGFHSQAGWIAFNAAACGLAFVSRRNAWLHRTPRRASATVETENPTATYMMPLLAVLIAGIVSHAFASDFDWLYPLRLVAGVAMLAFYRRGLAKIDWRWSWRGPAVGVLIFAVWIVAAWLLLPPTTCPVILASTSALYRGVWITSRIVTSVLVVPIVEELAYRGFLMRRLISRRFELVAYRSVNWLALCVSASAFGLPHGVMWLPATVAGLAYGFVLIRRGRIGEAVIAHATTNLLIAAAVLGWNQWQLW